MILINLVSHKEKSNKMVCGQVESVPSTSNASNRDNVVKILLLGAAESGKSTFLRQMRIIHNHPYTNEERREFINRIFSNVIEASKALINGMAKCGMSYEETTDMVRIFKRFLIHKIEKNSPQEHVNAIKNVSLNSVLAGNMSESLWEAVKALWQDENVKKVLLEPQNFNKI